MVLITSPALQTNCVGDVVVPLDDGDEGAVPAAKEFEVVNNNPRLKVSAVILFM